MAITPFKVIEGHRFWYQSKAHMRLPSSRILQRFQVMADHTVKFSLASGSRFTLTPSLGLIPANIAICDKPLKTRFFGLHFTRKICRSIFNHFHVIGPQCYRVRRNNANYTAITPFKVIRGHRFRYQSKPICDFLLVINSNLPSYLALFPSYGRLLVEFSLSIEGASL